MAQPFLAHLMARQQPEPIGSYEIEAEIARGGQGVLYRVRHRAYGDVHALKLLLDRDAEARARFLQEARLLTSLRNAHLPACKDYGDSPAGPFMVMDLIEGPDLQKLVREQGPLSLAMAVQVLTPIAQALDYLHGHGLVHRDVKPGNVLLERGTARPVLIDLGLVQRDPNRLRMSTLDGLGRLTLEGTVLGTPAYMAPEQLNGEASPASDVYALGATLYALLTGEPPFKASSPMTMFSILATEPAPDVRLKRPDVPAGVAELISRTMAKRPRDRPQSATEFAESLREACTPRASRKVARASRKVAVAMAAVVATAAAGTWAATGSPVSVAEALPAVASSAISPTNNRQLAMSHVAIAASHLDMINVAIASGRFQPGYVAALDESIVSALSADDSVPQAYSLRSALHAMRRNKPQALADAERAVELGPDLATSWFYRGQARQESGDLPGAMSDYMRAVSIDESLVEAWTNQSLVFLQQSDYENAIRTSTKAVEVGERASKKRYYVTNALLVRGQSRADYMKDYVGAESDLTCAIETMPCAVAFQARARARRYLKDYDGAAADMRAAGAFAK